MKKAFLILVIFSFIGATACSSDGDDKNTGTATDIQNETSIGNVAHITTAQFRQYIWDYKTSPNNWIYKGDVPCIIDFYADWCRPCKTIAPVMEELAKEYKGRIRIYKVNTDEERELSALFNISSIPAILFVPGNEKPQMSLGAMPKSSFEQAINEILKIK
jgi:thioredoxin